MLKIENTYEIEIVDLGHSGEGIGRVDGFTVFVEGGVTGDTVTATIKTLKKKYAIAELVEIIKPSDIRQNPICPVFEKCGGCQTQNIKYEEQLKIKRKLVVDALERIGHLKEVKVEETVGMEEPYRYRNKAQYPVANKHGKTEIGFYKKRSHEIVEFEDCYIQPDINNTVVETVKKFMDQYHISAYNEETGKGTVRHILTKVGFNTKQLMVVIVTNGRHLEHKEELIQMLDDEIVNFDSVIQNVNTSKGNKILGNENIVLHGKEIITDTLEKLEFEISPNSFYQVNPIQMKKLYDLAKEYADLTGNETVLDLYCGIGTIGMYLADKAKIIIGVEIVDEAIVDANKNAKRNNIENIEFHGGKAEIIVPKLQEKGMKADVAIVDPPRKGCDERLLETLIKISPKKIVYVSCNPSTLARDLKFLTENGYNVDKVCPVDMFPQTMHVEVVTLLTKS